MALQALLYSADGADRRLTRLDGLHPEALGPRQLLWVDLCDRYERAEDEVEGARDLVIGSFELLSTRAAQAMNETMQTLTFVTVLMGVLALISGVMGMNFQAPFFDTGAAGFFTVVGAMALFSAAGTWLAWRRGWI